jgi:hypothetical protein
MTYARTIPSKLQDKTDIKERTVEVKIIESGFTYVTELDGIKLFRKRK